MSEPPPTRAIPPSGLASAAGGPSPRMVAPSSSTHQGASTAASAHPTNASKNLSSMTNPPHSNPAPVHPQQPTNVDHPLSQPVPLTTYRPAGPAQQRQAAPSLSSPLRVAVPPPTVKPPQQQTAQPPPAPRPTTAIQTQTQTPEQEVDSFLAGPSTRTSHEDEPGPLPLLKPTPFPPNLTGIQQLQALVERRAWGDVVKVSAEMLMGGVSPYEKYYSQLVNGALTSTPGAGAGAGASAIDSSSIVVDGTTIIQEMIQILHWRIRALLFLRRYHDLKTEILRIRLLPSASYNDTLPSWIPLELILEGIEATFHVNMSSTGNHHKNGSQGIGSPGGGKDDGGERTEREELDLILDNLYELRKNHKGKIERGVDAAYVHDLLKVDTVLVNILVQREEWRLALHALDGMLDYAHDAAQSWFAKGSSQLSGDGAPVAAAAATSASDPDGTGTGTYQEEDLDTITKAVKIEIYSRQGKILLQAGALPAAATVFERAHDLYQTMNLDFMNSDSISLEDLRKRMMLIHHEKDMRLIRNVKTQILINEGLLHFAHIDYDLAEEKFRLAIECQRELQREDQSHEQKEEQGEGEESNTRGTTSLSLIQDGGELMGTEGDLLVPCLNNLALCALYTCRMREAVNMMEALVREDPTKYLTEVMVFNLCTLYELGSDNSMSERKKRVLQSIAKRFTLHDIGPENFRLH